MSRVGNAPITLPDGVNISTDGAVLTAKGSMGELSMTVPSNVDVKIEDNIVTVKPHKKDIVAKPFGVQPAPIFIIWSPALQPALPATWKLTGWGIVRRCRGTSCS